MLPQSFHPVIRSWFTENFKEPTPVQAESWPLIERGENVLALAPTGSGKTLTAFLSAVSRFCSSSGEKYDAEKLSVLYISPLKALNEDIKRNLLEPLAEIKIRFEKEGLVFPPIRVETRSGDTPQSHRRRFYIKPPSILALTPESLSILLLNPKGRQVLSNVKYLIIDEIHALLGNKRGAFLSCQIDRLSAVAGEFQRISLSATIRNPQTAADFTGGLLYETDVTGREQGNIKSKIRKVNIVAPFSEKQIDFSIEFPDLEIEKGEKEENTASRYTPLINYILKRIFEGSNLLVFADSRRRAERLCFLLNEESASFFARNVIMNNDIKNAQNVFSGTVAYPHHGSLSKEVRRSVEKGLAEGRLPCVVATSSLELGIDIGCVDEVVLAGSPSSVSQTLQRIGRSGHGVGQTSRGKLFALHGKDLLLAAALKSAVDERDIEEIHPIENPLDILAQLILSLCSEKDRNIDELYEIIKKYYIFKNLNFDSYNRVVNMLAGFSGEKSRLREIKPRIWLDKTEGKIGVLEGTTSLLYTSGGVIANRGLYSLRLADGTKIGELDEEFVWERRLGDCFDFGARGWRITNISSESVDVVPLNNRTENIPFWKGEIPFRSVNLTERLLSILEEYNKNNDVKLNVPDQIYAALKKLLDTQRKSQNGLPLPDKNNIIVEIITGNELNRDFCTIVIHNFRGGQVNYPLSLALSSEMERIIKLRVASFAGDDNILFLLPRLGLEDASFSPEEIFLKAVSALETPDGGIKRGERLFRNRLESSALFGANFREAAERSLLLPKSPFGKRTPLWIMRQRAKRLFDAVSNADGFPVTAESWRCCLSDTFDMNGFRDLTAAINNGSVTLSFFKTNTPSPFSRDLVREETNAFMYEYDERQDLAGKTHRATLSDKIIEEAAGISCLRPALKKSVIDEFTSKLRREIPGWAPEDILSLNEWIKERIAVPSDEWDILCSVLPETLIENIDKNKIKTITRKNALVFSVVHRDWEEDWKNEPLNLLGQWLRYEGPVSVERLCAIFGAEADEIQDALNALSEVDEAVCDVEIKDEKLGFICDRENLEMLLRLSRKKQKPEIKERPASLLVPFMALRQGLAGNNTDEEKSAVRKNLHAWTSPAKLWETEIFPARNSAYDTEKINREIQDGQIVWYGSGRERIGFCLPEDLDLSLNLNREKEKTILSPLLSSLFFNQHRDFWEIKNELNNIADINDTADSRSCVDAVWKEVWNGNLTSDSLDPVRKGIEAGFKIRDIEIPANKEIIYPFGRQRRIPGALKNRWKNGAPVQNRWYSLLMENDSTAGADHWDASALEEEALNQDRVRLLLKRWGILCRPLLEREEAQFSWSKLLPSMRRMELSGELAAGRFFSGINSLQFASNSIAGELEKAENFNGLYWMNAADPASPAGLDIDTGYRTCARSVSNRLYYRGKDLIAVSCKNGKELQIFIKADDPDIVKLIELLKIPRTRKVLPENKLPVEKINGVNAAESDYAPIFKEYGFLYDRGKLIFW